MCTNKGIGTCELRQGPTTCQSCFLQMLVGYVSRTAGVGHTFTSWTVPGSQRLGCRSGLGWVGGVWKWSLVSALVAVPQPGRPARQSSAYRSGWDRAMGSRGERREASREALCSLSWPRQSGRLPNRLSWTLDMSGLPVQCPVRNGWPTFIDMCRGDPPGFSSQNSCCACYNLTFTSKSNTLQGESMVVQLINTRNELSKYR